MKSIVLIQFCILACLSMQGQTLIHQFNLNGNYNDTVGSAVLVDTNTLTNAFIGDHWTWTVNTNPGGGMHLSIPDAGFTESNYSIGIDFMYYETGAGYRKIIDFKNLTSDNGFYFLSNRFVSYPTGTFSSSSVPDSTRFSFIFTRNGTNDSLKIYSVVNNVLTLEMAILDNPANSSVADLVGGNRVMWLFQDEPITFGEWTTGGDVYSIKIWNGVLSPETIDSVFLLSTQLLNFTTVPMNEASIQADWTISESNNLDHFEIERSLDGHSFHFIRKVAANEQTEAYSYVDYNVLPNVDYYYRLKMVDENGGIEYSPISVARLITDKSYDNVSLYPNPIGEGDVVLGIKIKEEKAVSLKVYNDLGQLIYTQKMQLQIGTNNITIDADNWANGLYVVHVIGENFSAVERLTKNK